MSEDAARGDAVRSEGWPTRTIAVQFRPEGMGLRGRAMLRGIAQVGEREGWHVAVDPYAVESGAGRYDGLIATARKGRGPKLAASPVPVVLAAWGHIHQPQLPRVVANRRAGGRMVARHLVERGYRRFNYVGFSKQTQSAVERWEFSLELEKLGRPVGSARTFMTYAASRGGWEKVMRVLGRWLHELTYPVGLLVARPLFARAVADLALRRGLRVPEDVGVVSADDDPALCGLPPALSRLHFDYAEVGRRAAELLGRLMAGAKAPERNVLVAPTLVPGRSTDREGAADPVVAKALWFIDSHCTESIGPGAVAAAVGLSERVLGKRMRRARGRSVPQEIARARVEHAKLQLVQPNSLVRPVARESGFGSYSSMLRAFREHVGTSPSAWREQAMARRRGSADAETDRGRRSWGKGGGRGRG